MQFYQKSLRYLRLSLDVLILLITYLTASYILFYPKMVQLTLKVEFIFFVLFFVWIISSTFTNLYDEFRSRNFTFEIISVVKNVFIQSIAAIVVLFFVDEKHLNGYFIFIYPTMLFILLTFEKMIYRKVLQAQRKKGKFSRNLVIVGAGDVAKNFYETIRKNPQFGYNTIGFLDDNKLSFLNGLYLGKIDELDNILSTREVNDVIVALPEYSSSRLEEVIRICENHTTRVKVIPDYFKFMSSKYKFTLFGRFPIISVREDRINEIHWRFIKRVFDISVTLLLFLLVFWWLWPIIAILIKLSSRGPVFFKQERWGRDNKRFTTYKFRSMVINCEEFDVNGQFKQATKDDKRITKIGRLLRKTSLDELPQFWNVLKGDMSLVGPRPHPTPLNIESKSKVYLYMLRHLVTPGLTGWAQIKGFRGETSDLAQMQERINHDVWYIENWSFKLDIQILLLTIWLMIIGDKNAY